jgi:hypothetical protein
MMRSVEAVDGSNIALSGTKHVQGENKQTQSLVITILCCILGLIIQGGDAEIASGSSMDATVEMTTTVEVDTGP